jgi:hypothetical protein
MAAGFLPVHDWSAAGGPDTFTLRAWLGVEKAAETVDGLDYAANFMQHAPR